MVNLTKAAWTGFVCEPYSNSFSYLTTCDGLWSELSSIILILLHLQTLFVSLILKLKNCSLSAFQTSSFSEALISNVPLNPKFVASTFRFWLAMLMLVTMNVYRQDDWRCVAFSWKDDQKQRAWRHNPEMWGEGYQGQLFHSQGEVPARARWFLWNVSASSHMTSVTQRNILDPMGVVGDCSYTPHNNHLFGWILK